jgi:hypothetical protein
MMPAKNDINKENIDMYLNEFAEECKKLNYNIKPIKIILVGGAAILLNYNFRKSTDDIDVLNPSLVSINEAVKNTAKRLNITDDWLNDDFKKSPSYSEKINDVSVLYKNISNILEIRTINSEYLIAMKLMTDRIDKHDISDIAGVVLEHKRNNNPLNQKDIENAVCTLYGSLEKLPNDSLMLLNNLFKVDDYEKLYVYFENKEKDARKTLKKLEKNSMNDMVFIDGDILKRKVKNIINEKYKDSDNKYFGTHKANNSDDMG